jgi:predicted nucleic acid-binding protein
MVLDTNILIYAAKPGGQRLNNWVQDPNATVSIISRIEALGYPGITLEEKTALQNIFEYLPEAGLTEAIAARAITLRQQRKIGLADAVLAATALESFMPLVTRNVEDFKHIEGLRLINPFEPSSVDSPSGRGNA